MKTVLTIAGSDSGGGAGIQADMKAFSAFGVYGTCVITALTAQNTKGVEGVFKISPEFVAKQIDAVMTDINPRVWKTGMLSNSKIINAVVNSIKKYKLQLIVVDPVMIAKGGETLLSHEAKSSLIKKLIPLSFVVTPNYDEAEVLTGYKVQTITDMKKAAVAIKKMGATYVVVKGGHVVNDRAVDVLYDGKNFKELSAKRIKTKNTHGTGCTFASAIAAGIAKGNSVFTAVKNAKEYITRQIKNASYVHIGHGYGPVQVF